MVMHLRIFTDSVFLKAELGTSFKLAFPEPAPKGSKYKEIGWMQGNPTTESRIVFYQQFMTDNKPLYFNKYCEELNQCKVSHKGYLNAGTGELIIRNVTFNDEDSYFYWFWVDDTVPDTGVKYKLNLEVYGESHFFSRR